MFGSPIPAQTIRGSPGAIAISPTDIVATYGSDTAVHVVPRFVLRKMPPDALATSRATLRDYGNMSSATVLFIMQKLLARGAQAPCVAIGFGPGLNVEVALFE